MFRPHLALALPLFLFALASPLAAQEVTAPDAKLKLVASEYSFTEGPAADSQGNVYFTDQPNDRILRWSAEDHTVTTWLTPAGRSNGLFFDRDGFLIACADGKNELWRIGPDKKTEVLIGRFDGMPFNGPNDVWVAGDNSYYFTDPFYRRDYWIENDRQPQLPRRVYRLAPDRKTLTIAADGFVQPNGIVGDAKRGLLYVADIGDKKTYRFRMNEDGKLVDRELFCEMGSDGMTLDEQGNLYLTGRGVTVFAPDGKRRQNIGVPKGWTANVCFGGKDRKTLFITASDSLFTIEMNAAGLATRNR